MKDIMEIIERPPKEIWDEILQRPALDSQSLEQTVAEILADVKENGDAALRRFALQFDKAALDDLLVTGEEFAAAEREVSPDLKAAIKTACANIDKFHAPKPETREIVETTPGVFCWRKTVAIEKVGLYVPAGGAPLFSTVLMLAIPAKLAGCREIILCSPPDARGKIDPVTLYAAKVCGATKVFKIGGAQAIAAMAFGTESVPKVYKIFGPGNQYVTEAKQQVTRFGVAIDMPAGPSELAVLADDTCVPAFVAADLLSQAEHGPDSQVVLVSPSKAAVEATLAEIKQQLADLPRRETAERALANSKAIIVADLDEGLALLNSYAPEHLIIATADADALSERAVNAGSVFIGNYSCESAGDYASGTNHTLPTAGYARSFDGVSTESFTKKITFQKLTKEGILNLGPVIETMAAAEGLEAHKRAISIRLAEVNAE